MTSQGKGKPWGKAVVLATIPVANDFELTLTPGEKSVYAVANTVQFSSQLSKQFCFNDPSNPASAKKWINFRNIKDNSSMILNMPSN